MDQAPQKNEFEQAGQEAGGSLVSEIWSFLKHNKKWWLLPIVLLLLFFGVMLFMSGTVATPFIYTLF